MTSAGYDGHTAALQTREGLGEPATGRVLFIVNRADFFLSHRQPIADALRARGFEVHVATAPSPYGAEIEAQGYAWHPVPLRGRSVNPLADLVFAIALVRLLRRLRPVLVHNVAVKSVIYGGLAARVARVPAVVSALTGLGYLFIDPSPRARVLRAIAVRLFREGYRHRNLVALFQNPDDAFDFVEHGIVHPAQVAVIVGSGVDVEAFAPAETPPAAPPLVVFPARLLRDKGVGEFLDAARRLVADGVAARFALLGDVDPLNPNSLAPADVEAIRREGLVEVPGHCADMPGALREAHITCLPSYREGTPKALLEAAACGLPIVTTDVPGCREVVREGENGLLVPMGDAGSLAQALRRLIEDPELRARFGAASRLRALKEFRVEHVVEATMQLYDRVLDAGPTSGGIRSRGATGGLPSPLPPA